MRARARMSSLGKKKMSLYSCVSSKRPRKDMKIVEDEKDLEAFNVVETRHVIGKCRNITFATTTRFRSSLMLIRAHRRKTYRSMSIHEAAKKGFWMHLCHLIYFATQLIDAKDEHGWTPLHRVADSRHEHVNLIAYCLISNGSEASHMTNDEGRTPLHLASSKGNVTLVELFLKEAPITMDVTDNHQMTALHFAARHDHPCVVSVLLESGSSALGMTDEMGYTPLIHATKEGHFCVVSVMLNHDPTAADETTCCGVSALHIAALNGEDDIVSLLLDHGTRSLDAWSFDKSPLTPLHLSALYGHVDVASLLLDHGSCSLDAWCPGSLPATPLHLAAGHGHVDVVSLLLDRGSCSLDAWRPDSSDNKIVRPWMSPLHLAARYGHVDVVSLLLDRGSCMLNVKDTKGRTPLHCAAKYGHTDVAALLLDRGSQFGNVRTDNEDAWEPAHCAAMYGRVDFLSLLLDRVPLALDAINLLGGTLLHTAALHGKADIVSLLLDRGSCSLNAKTVCGATPLDLAAANGQTDIVALLRDRGSRPANARDDAAQRETDFDEFKFGDVDSVSKWTYQNPLALDAVGKNGETLGETFLRVATEIEDWDMTAYLVHRGKSKGADDVDVEVLRDVAVRNGHASVVVDTPTPHVAEVQNDRSSSVDRGRSRTMLRGVTRIFDATMRRFRRHLCCGVLDLAVTASA